MNAIFLYLLKAALINALMLGFYHFAIRPGRNFKLMRTVLLLAIALPLLLPLMPQPVIHQNDTAVPIYVFSLPDVSTSVVIMPEENQSIIPWLQNAVYVSVTSILLLGIFLSVISILRKYLRTYKKPTPYGKVLIDNAANSPYSFFHWVFFSEEGLLHPAANWLLRHEFSHVRHGHSFDRLLSGLFRSFFWFSPFAHFNTRLLSEVHEYQADADAIEEYGDRTAYSNLISTFAGLHGQQPFTNPFSAHLKKRMIMINHLKPGKLQLARIAAGITIVAAFAIFSSMVTPGGKSEVTPKTENEQSVPVADNAAPVSALAMDQATAETTIALEDTIYPAVFPGGEAGRIKFYQENIKYPAEARNKNIQGVVQYKIFIETDGKVTNPSIISGIGGGCDEEVLRVAALMPNWKPAMKDGKPVRTSVILPISFKLSNGDDDSEQDQIFTVVENSPQFTGGDEARVAYLQKAISYPEQARKDKIEGTVYVTFVIEKDGKISNAKVLRGIGGGCDEVALNAIQNMPTWIPGKQRGEPVRVQFNMPIKFTLDNSKELPVKTPEVSIMYGGREVFNIVDTPPVFPGGMDALLTYIRKKTGRPNLVNKQTNSPVANSSVYLSFIIEPDGKVTPGAVSVLAGEESDTFVLAVKDMPDWQPGSKDGKSVPVMIRLFLADEKAY
jgi:TonB family protein